MVFAAYALFTVLFSVFSYSFIDPNLMYLKTLYTGFAFTNRLEVSLFYISFISVFFGFYLYFLSLVHKKILTIKFVIVVILLSIPLLFSYPAMLSYDLFNYQATAKVIYHYGENPYLVMPIELAGDPMLLFTRAANKYALYGPLWIVLTGVPYMSSFGNFIIQLFLFKFFVGLFYVGVVFLLYKLSKSVFTVVFFAMNPLVLIETFMSGHNDIVMMFFVLLGYHLIKQEKYMLSVLPFVFSVLIKFSTLFLFPVWIYMYYKKIKNQKLDWGRVWILSLVSMGIIFLLSPLREEMYPWYFIWLIPFAALIRHKNLLIWTAAFSGGLLMTYVPYMYTGYYITLYKIIATVCFMVVFVLLCKVFKQAI